MVRKKKIKEIIIKHIENNSKEYLLVSIIFLIGIFLGVMFINKSKESQITEITSYLGNYIETLRNIEDLETISLLKNSLIQNIEIGLIIWFFGTTIIRNTNSFWSNTIQGFLLRIHNCNSNNNIRSWKRINVYL